MPGGESRKDVENRVYNTLNNVLEKYKDKKIFIVTHGTALNCLFSKIAKVVFTDYKKYKIDLYFKDELVFEGNYEAPELFKLEFDENNKLETIKNIKITY